MYFISLDFRVSIVIGIAYKSFVKPGEKSNEKQQLDNTPFFVVLTNCTME